MMLNMNYYVEVHLMSKKREKRENYVQIVANISYKEYKELIKLKNTGGKMLFVLKDESIERISKLDEYQFKKEAGLI